MNKSVVVLRLFRKYRSSCLSPSTFRTLATSRIKCQSFCTLPKPSKIVNKYSSSLLDDELSTISNHTCIRNYAKGAIVKEGKGKSGKPKVKLSDEDLISVFNPEAMNRQMQVAVDKLKADYVKHMSVRSTGGIEKLPVLIEDEEFPLNEIAQLFRKSPELVVINMTNFPEAIKAVLEALSKSGMNASSQQDGTMIYVTFPKITREHRQNIATSAKTRFNKAKVEIKDVQDKFTREVKKQKGVVSDDLIFNVSEHIRYVCQNYVQDAENVFKTKEKELLGE